MMFRMEVSNNIILIVPYVFINVPKVSWNNACLYLLVNAFVVTMYSTNKVRSAPDSVELDSMR